MTCSLLNRESRAITKGQFWAKLKSFNLPLSWIVQELMHFAIVEPVKSLIEALKQADDLSPQKLAQIACRTLSETQAHGLPLNVRFWIDRLLEEVIDLAFSKADQLAGDAVGQINVLIQILKYKERAKSSQLPFQVTRHFEILNDCFESVLQLTQLIQKGFLYNSPKIAHLRQRLESNLSILFNGNSENHGDDSANDCKDKVGLLNLFYVTAQLSESLNSGIGNEENLLLLKSRIDMLLKKLRGILTLLKHTDTLNDQNQSPSFSTCCDEALPFFLKQEIEESFSRYFCVLPNKIRNGAVWRCANFMTRDGEELYVWIIRRRELVPAEGGHIVRFVWEPDLNALASLAPRLLPKGNGDETVLMMINDGELVSLVKEIAIPGITPHQKKVLNWSIRDIRPQNMHSSSFTLQYAHHVLKLQVRLIGGRICVVSEQEELEGFLKKINPIVLGDHVIDPSSLTRISTNPITEGCVLGLIAASDSSFVKCLLNLLCNEDVKFAVFDCLVRNQKVRLICLKDDAGTLEILVNPEDRQILLAVGQTESLDFIKITPESLWLYNPDLFFSIPRRTLNDYRYHVYNNLRGSSNCGRFAYYEICGIPILATLIGKEVIGVPVSLLELVNFDLAASVNTPGKDHDYRPAVFPLNKERLKLIFDAGCIPKAYRTGLQRMILEPVRRAFRNRKGRDTSITLELKGVKIEVTIRPKNMKARESTRTVLSGAEFLKFLNFLRGEGCLPTLIHVTAKHLLVGSAPIAPSDNKIR